MKLKVYLGKFYKNLFFFFFKYDYKRDTASTTLEHQKNPWEINLHYYQLFYKDKDNIFIYYLDFPSNASCSGG